VLVTSWLGSQTRLVFNILFTARGIYIRLYKLTRPMGSDQWEFSDEIMSLYIQWKPLIMITLGPALFDNNNLLITLRRGYKNLHYLTQFIVISTQCALHSDLRVLSQLSSHCPLSSSLVNS
jgi:hypothetical protein